MVLEDSINASKAEVTRQNGMGDGAHPTKPGNQERIYSSNDQSTDECNASRDAIIF